MRRKEDLRGLAVTWKQPCGNRLDTSQYKIQVVGTQVDDEHMSRCVLCDIKTNPILDIFFKFRNAYLSLRESNALPSLCVKWLANQNLDV